MQTVFITGGTGYIGTRLIKALVKENNFHIKALVRTGSENKIPLGCEIIFGNALDAATYQNSISPATIFVHLIGVAHPSPAKKEQFKSIDLVSIQQAVKAATCAGISYFVYLSVAMYPAKIMKDFQQVRTGGEALLLKQNFVSTFVRPWYVLGPGHWWPVLLKPVYFILKLFPSTRSTAKNLDTVTIGQIIKVLVNCIKNQPKENNIIDVQAMRRL